MFGRERQQPDERVVDGPRVPPRTGQRERLRALDIDEGHRGCRGQRLLCPTPAR